MGMIDLIKKVAKRLSKGDVSPGGPSTNQSSEETLDQKEPVDMGDEPKEIKEHEIKKKKNKQEEDKPAVVVQGAETDKDEAALQYMIELMKNGKKVEEALALTKEAFYKDASSFKKFCSELKLIQTNGG